MHLLVRAAHEKHVRRLEIAVHHAHRVRGGKPTANLTADRDGGARGKLANAIAEAAQVLAFEQLGHQTRKTVARSDHVHHFDHVLAGNASCGLRFALEARHRFGENYQRLVHHLDRKAARKAHVLGFVDAAHSALTEKLDDTKGAGEHFANERIVVGTLGRVERGRILRANQKVCWVFGPAHGAPSGSHRDDGRSIAERIRQRTLLRLARRRARSCGRRNRHCWRWRNGRGLRESRARDRSRTPDRDDRR